MKPRTYLFHKPSQKWADTFRSTRVRALVVSKDKLWLMEEEPREPN